MAQPDAEDVKNIIDTDLSDSIITSFIDDAYNFLMDVVGTENSTVQKWLAAHLIAFSRERQAKSEEAKGTGVTYTGNYTVSLYATSYGQTACSLDQTGLLAKASGKRTAKLSAVRESYDYYKYHDTNW